jgi:hypothetical protein
MPLAARHFAKAYHRSTDCVTPASNIITPHRSYPRMPGFSHFVCRPHTYAVLS